MRKSVMKMSIDILTWPRPRRMVRLARVSSAPRAKFRHAAHAVKRTRKCLPKFEKERLIITSLAAPDSWRGMNSTSEAFKGIKKAATGKSKHDRLLLQYVPQIAPNHSSEDFHSSGLEN